MYCTSTKLSKFILFAIKSQNGKNAEFLIFKSRSKIVHFIQWAEFYKRLNQALKVSSFSEKSWVTTPHPPFRTSPSTVLVGIKIPMPRLWYCFYTNENSTKDGALVTKICCSRRFFLFFCHLMVKTKFFFKVLIKFQNNGHTICNPKYIFKKYLA